VHNETQALKKAASSHRSEIAALKRRILELEKQLRRQSKAMAPKHDDAEDGAQTALLGGVHVVQCAGKLGCGVYSVDKCSLPEWLSLGRRRHPKTVDRHNPLDCVR
jgi:hypothetical protein